MPQHRTRDEKEKAQKARLKQVSQSTPEGQYSYSYSGAADSTRKSANATLLKVDQRYIIKDLIKTLSISGLLLFVVIGIYFYLRYN